MKNTKKKTLTGLLICIFLIAALFLGGKLLFYHVSDAENIWYFSGDTAQRIENIQKLPEHALDDYDYTVRLEELTGSLSHKNSNAQQAGSTAVTGDADTTAPTADSPRDGTQTEPASDAADMTQMQDILPEEEID